ncbi:hypothetical protein PLICRDRAFT_33151 [Plicaturopsis crispa FD-325 SS-3]|uniref:C2H2-type domain-containing protein n=1 Tax=Plicaturopsis crispa FD-325 SS-3 TaxID=944288 RepID=A0A0C9SVD9_PLICR|nr:hypothetical protein PLICRDRAFT_33151 [Plicaturopsis crispa FD-325 SS-3]
MQRLPPQHEQKFGGKGKGRLLPPTIREFGTMDYYNTACTRHFPLSYPLIFGWLTSLQQGEVEHKQSKDVGRFAPTSKQVERLLVSQDRSLRRLRTMPCLPNMANGPNVNNVAFEPNGLGVSLNRYNIRVASKKYHHLGLRAWLRTYMMGGPGQFNCSYGDTCTRTWYRPSRLRRHVPVHPGERSVTVVVYSKGWVTRTLRARGVTTGGETIATAEEDGAIEKDGGRAGEGESSDDDDDDDDSGEEAEKEEDADADDAEPDSDTDEPQMTLGSIHSQDGHM